MLKYLKKSKIKEIFKNKNKITLDEAIKLKNSLINEILDLRKNYVYLLNKYSKNKFDKKRIYDIISEIKEKENNLINLKLKIRKANKKIIRYIFELQHLKEEKNMLSKVKFHKYNNDFGLNTLLDKVSKKIKLIEDKLSIYNNNKIIKTW